MILHYALILTTACFALAMLLNLWRLAKGPDAIDRVLALDTLFVNAIALIIVAGIGLATHLLFEVGLLIAMLGFVGTVAFCKYLLRGDVIE